MQLSCSPILFFKELAIDKTMCLEDWFKLASELGFEGTEIHEKSLERSDKQELSHLMDVLGNYHLKVSQLTCATDFTNPDPVFRDREVQNLMGSIDVVNLLGGCCLRVTAGQMYPGIPREKAISWVVDCFRRSLDYSQEKGVWLAYENHYKDYFWERPDFSLKHDIYLEIIEQLTDTPLKVNFDCSNPLMIGEDPVPLLVSVLDRVIHVHCSDRATPFEYMHSIPGEGLVDFGSIFHTLKGANWDGWLSIEYNGTEGIRGLRQACAFIRAKWKEA